MKTRTFGRLVVHDIETKEDLEEFEKHIKKCGMHGPREVTEGEDCGRKYIDVRYGSHRRRHHVGDKKCCQCWFDYPKECECGGLVHRNTTSRADADYNYLFYDFCDTCGKDCTEDK